MRRVCLLHTVPSLPPVFAELVAREVGDLDVRHIVDENLLADTIESGMLPRTRRRVAEHVAYAEESGAGAVLVTCSSIGGAAELARAYAGIPVFRVDEPMAVEAAATGATVGVLATLSSTLEPTAELIRRHTDAEVVTTVCPGAFQALRSGDTEAHDRIVADEARRLAADTGVLVLAQASMARAVRSVSVDVPVLTSPESGVRQLATVQFS